MKKQLEPDEIICSKCTGSGYILIKMKKYLIESFCNKCFGIGKLSWIDDIFGVKASDEQVEEFWCRPDNF